MSFASLTNPKEAPAGIPERTRSVNNCLDAAAVQHNLAADSRGVQPGARIYVNRSALCSQGVLDLKSASGVANGNRFAGVYANGSGASYLIALLDGNRFGAEQRGAIDSASTIERT